MFDRSQILVQLKCRQYSGRNIQFDYTMINFRMLSDHQNQEHHAYLFKSLYICSILLI